MALDDIQFLSTGSYSQPSIIVTLDSSGSLGSPVLIEAQTVYFENKIYPESIDII
jgi:hypothetical protein